MTPMSGSGGGSLVNTPMSGQGLGMGVDMGMSMGMGGIGLGMGGAGAGTGEPSMIGSGQATVYITSYNGVSLNWLVLREPLELKTYLSCHGLVGTLRLVGRNR